MNARRVQLGLKWTEVASRAGLSTEALRAIRQGENTPRDLTVAGIETALSWPTGTVSAILNGEPVPAEPYRSSSAMAHTAPDAADEWGTIEVQLLSLVELRLWRRVLVLQLRSVDEELARRGDDAIRGGAAPPVAT